VECLCLSCASGASDRVVMDLTNTGLQNRFESKSSSVTGRDLCGESRVPHPRVARSLP